MENKIEYCFVVDKDNQPLAPTKVNKGWYLIRKGRARLKSKHCKKVNARKCKLLWQFNKIYWLE